MTPSTVPVEITVSYMGAPLVTAEIDVQPELAEVERDNNSVTIAPDMHGIIADALEQLAGQARGKARH